MAEPEDIVTAALAVLDGPAEASRAEAGRADGGGARLPAGSGTTARGDQGDLAGVRVVVSREPGGTREPFDPVRFVGKRSSGRQGVAIAADAVRRGATVTLVAANVDAG